MPDRSTRVGVATSVARVLAQLESHGAARAAVVERGSAVGTLDVAVLTLARRHGLGGLAVRDILVDEPSRARPRSRQRGSFRGRLPQDQVSALKQLASLARETGVRAYLVGGVVRDLQLGRPTRDLDVVVEGDARPLARLLGGRVRFHESFGTATVVLHDGVHVDLAQARKEHYARPAALPTVSPASLEEDLRRRDFAINALALRLTERGPGRLFDPCGGLGDLRLGRLRALHGLSFIEDPTRAFRAVRLAADLGFEIAPRTSRLIRVAVDRAVVDRLSAARVRRELQKVLESSCPGKSVRLLARHGLLATLDPTLRPQRGIYAALDRVPHVVRWYRSFCSDDLPRSWVVGLGLLWRAAAPGSVERAIDRLQPGRSARTILRQAPEAQRRIENELSRPRALQPSAVFATCRGEPAEVLLMLLAGSTSQRARRRIESYLSRLRRSTPVITGHDLLRAGVAPGPAIARGLAAALDAQLDGQATGAAAQLRVALAAAGRS